jgi:NAD(P)-dependent dehydrogenase (short-subunit alcohol dehydrogenase family)
MSSTPHNPLHHPSLRERVVVITGGSRGFGWAIAEQLLKAGARTMLTASRNSEELAEASRRANAIAGPGRCITRRADVADWSDCEATIADTVAAFGRVDVLINNAGRGSSEYASGSQRMPFHEIPAPAFRTIVETNLIGAFQMTKAVLPHFLTRGFGKVISISTSLTTMCMPGFSPYGASKVALELTHRVWAQELQGRGVDMNILLPGGASDTAFVSQAMRPGVIGRRSDLLPGDIVVPPAVWLCSDATNGLTGRRFIAKHWDRTQPPDEALRGCMQPSTEFVGVL